MIPFAPPSWLSTFVSPPPTREEPRSTATKPRRPAPPPPETMSLDEAEDYTRRRDLEEDALIAAADRGHGPESDEVLRAAIARIDRKVTRDRSGGADLIELLVRAYEAEHGYVCAAREPQPAHEILKMPMPTPASFAAEQARVEAVRAEVARSRIPKECPSGRADYRAELANETFLDIRDEPNAIPLAVDRARKRLSKLTRKISQKVPAKSRCRVPNTMKAFVLPKGFAPANRECIE